MTVHLSLDQIRSVDTIHLGDRVAGGNLRHQCRRRGRPVPGSRRRPQGHRALPRPLPNALVAALPSGPACSPSMSGAPPAVSRSDSQLGGQVGRRAGQAPPRTESAGGSHDAHGEEPRAGGVVQGGVPGASRSVPAGQWAVQGVANGLTSPDRTPAFRCRMPAVSRWFSQMPCTGHYSRRRFSRGDIRAASRAGSRDGADRRHDGGGRRRTLRHHGGSARLCPPPLSPVQQTGQVGAAAGRTRHSSGVPEGAVRLGSRAWEGSGRRRDRSSSRFHGSSDARRGRRTDGADRPLVGSRTPGGGGDAASYAGLPDDRPSRGLYHDGIRQCVCC